MSEGQDKEVLFGSVHRQHTRQLLVHHETSWHLQLAVEGRTGPAPPLSQWPYSQELT